VVPSRADAAPAPVRAGGDVDDIRPGDRLLLIVEHDPKFAAVLLEMAHEKGFKGLITPSGEAALQMARDFKPDAITLDLQLPDMFGWAVLDRLKHDVTTRHIPVHIISVDENTARGMKQGAVACLKKPVSRQALTDAFASMKRFVERKTRDLLVIEDNEIERNNIVGLVGDTDLTVTAVGTAAEALAALRERRFDCAILDLRLPDMPGLELIEEIRGGLGLRDLPVIVYTGKDLTPAEETRLGSLTETIIAKDARSLDRLLERAALFLHQVESKLPAPARQLARQAHLADAALAGKKVLVVDDDLRNVFALTSMLERWKMEVVSAENGREALETLQANPDVDVVLMDIMMPEMDGYQTMQAVRKLGQFRGLPIIALTAKAMREDRQKCLDAGASDYVAKPVNAVVLQSLLRVWLTQPSEAAAGPA
jgi:CheY-like chemotaxis protein